MLGISGRVCNFKMLHSERSDGISSIILETLTEEQRKQVIHVCTDNPSPELFQRLKAVLPNLKWLSLDPMHICYKFNRSQGK